MAWSAKAVANEFIDLADGRNLSPMKLQKLVYFAHGWHLAIRDRPLVREEIEAWQFGPVIPSLYQEFKFCGAGDVKEFATSLNSRSDGWIFPRIPKSEDAENSQHALKLISGVWKSYGKYSATRLSNATHLAGTPWERTYSPVERHKVIPNALIKQYFEAQKRDV